MVTKLKQGGLQPRDTPQLSAEDVPDECEERRAPLFLPESILKEIWWPVWMGMGPAIRP